jgi:DNA-directed RNA polymerase subunit F
MNPKVIEEVPISIYDLKKEVAKIQKRDTTLSLRAAKTEEYLNNFATMKPKDAESLEEEIRKLDIPRFKDQHIKKLVDTIPESIEEVKVILQGYALTVSKENMQKIVEAIAKHNSK